MWLKCADILLQGYFFKLLWFSTAQYFPLKSILFFLKKKKKLKTKGVLVAISWIILIFYICTCKHFHSPRNTSLLCIQKSNSYGLWKARESFLNCKCIFSLPLKTISMFVTRNSFLRSLLKGTHFLGCMGYNYFFQAPFRTYFNFLFLMIVMLTTFFGPSNSVVQLHEFTFNKLPSLHISVKPWRLNTCK